MERDGCNTKCEECEFNCKKVVICLDCIETFCMACDSKLHKKGTRVFHKRVNPMLKFYEDPKTGFRICYFARKFYRNHFTEIFSNSEKIRKLSYDYLLDLTKKGTLMVELEKLAEFINKDKEYSLEEISKALKEDTNI